jgi:hypothetical protein
MRGAVTRILTILALATAGSLSGCLATAEHQPTVSNPASPHATAGAPERVVYDDRTRTVSISYAGESGFRDASQNAPRYCGERYGRSYAQVLTDDRGEGLATFACAVQ